MELRAHEQCMTHVINEQRVNNTQMVVKKKYAIDIFKAIIDKNECMTKAVADTCRFVPKLDIPKDEPLDVRIPKLGVIVREVKNRFGKGLV